MPIASFRERVTSCVVVVVLGLVVSVGRAEADEDHLDAYLGVMVNKTSISDHPTVSEGFTTVMAPTFSFRMWSGRLNWGFAFEGGLAAISEFLSVGYTSPDLFMAPFLGTDLGLAYNVGAGRVSVNVVLDSLAIKSSPVDDAGWVDLGLQLHVTHPVSRRGRVNLVLQGASAHSDNSSGAQFSARLDGAFDLTTYLGAFAAVTFDYRGIPRDDMSGENYHLSTVMLRFGINFHSRGQ